MSLPLLLSLLPKLPHLLTSTATHLLSLNPHSQHWDLRTVLIISLLQSFMASPGTHDRRGRLMTVEQVQAMSNSPRELDEKTWVAPVSIPIQGAVSEEEILALEEMVDRAVRELGVGMGVGGQEVNVDRAKVVRGGYEGEWVGWRNGKRRGGWDKGKKKGEEWDGKRVWDAMREDVTGFREEGAEEGVVLWLHGGAYFICDPITHRPMGKYVSKEFGGPVFLPRYRLAPQHPFPAAIVDALLSYLYLLYPPSGSLHSAYTPSNIFFGGDSAGGGLTLAFTQLLLWFQKPNPDGSKKLIRWMGREVELQVPKGLLIMSAWVDIARCLPSEVSCARGDYLPTPEQGSRSRYRQSEAWPAREARTLFHVDDSAVTHPLVSPIMARTWEGCPPVWWCVGDECLRDSNLFFAHLLSLSHVPLHFSKYTSMPHVFPMVLPRNPTSPHSFKSIGRFLKHHLLKSPTTQYDFKKVGIHPKTLAEQEIPQEDFLLGGMTVERLRGLMEEEVGRWVRKVREPEGEGKVEGEGVGTKVEGGAKL